MVKNVLLTAIQKENTAPVLVTALRGVFLMNKEEAILNYKTAMSVFKNWHSDGLMSDEELLKIDTIIAEKYGVSLLSIYRENDLLNVKSRSNIP